MEIEFLSVLRKWKELTLPEHQTKGQESIDPGHKAEVVRHQ